MNFEFLLATVGANLLWQSALVSAVVFFALKVLPRTEAKLRYYISLTGLIGVFLLLFAPLLPNFLTGATSVALPAPDPTLFEPAVISDTAKPHQQMITTSSFAAPLQSFAWISYLLGLWLAGALLALAALVRSAVLGQLWIRQAQMVALPTTPTLSRQVDIRRSTKVSAPMVIGFPRPTILIPYEFNFDLRQESTLAVLEHEIAHINRGDLWMNLVQRIVLALLWWSLPLYWVNKQVCIEREKLCDDLAKSQTGTGHALAKALVDLAAAQRHQKNPLLSIGIQPYTHPRVGLLAERIHRLCKEKNMPRLSKKTLLASSLIMPFTLAVLTIVSPRATAAQAEYEALEPGERKVSALEHALFMAASEKRLDEARMLLQTGTNPNFEVPGDGTPLIRAAINGDLDMAALLLAHNAEIDAYSDSDESALINAVRSNELAMVDYLVQSGADVSLGRVVNQISQPEWRSPLSEAKKYGHVEIINYLKSAGAVEDNRINKKPAGTIVEGRLTSPFGVVRTRFGSKPHKGLDIAAIPGTPIFAPADARVLQVTDRYEDNPDWGHVVVIESSGGVKTLFAHLKDSQVRVGETVGAGTKIAHVGNTGKSTGPHVHIQTFVDNKLVDPKTVWTSLDR